MLKLTERCLRAVGELQRWLRVCCLWWSSASWHPGLWQTGRFGVSLSILHFHLEKQIMTEVHQEKNSQYSHAQLWSSYLCPAFSDRQREQDRKKKKCQQTWRRKASGRDGDEHTIKKRGERWGRASGRVLGKKRREGRRHNENMESRGKRRGRNVETQIKGDRDRERSREKPSKQEGRAERHRGASPAVIRAVIQNSNISVKTLITSFLSELSFLILF